MKEKFQEKNFRASSMEQIELVNSILEEYENLGFDLTLRQLFYQLVSRDHIPNTQKAYTTLGKLVSNGRLAGLIDWNMIVDRGRSTTYAAHWDDPREIVRACASQFRIEKWNDQENHVEVVIEKQALEGVLEPVCAELDVRLTANKGYSSQSFMYRMGARLEDKLRADKRVHILYLGDHDPSGLDMDRDVEERLTMFASAGYGHVRVQRVALTWEQVEELNPPENPAKLTDSRAAEYIKQFGHSSWELDAIEPRALAGLVQDAVLELRDEDTWAKSVELEKTMRGALQGVAETLTW